MGKRPELDVWIIKADKTLRRYGADLEQAEARRAAMLRHPSTNNNEQLPARDPFDDGDDEPLSWWTARTRNNADGTHHYGTGHVR